MAIRQARLLRVGLCLLLFAAILGICVPAMSSDEDFKFTYSNGQASLTGYSGTSTKISIPAESNGYPVISIGESAFKGFIKLKNVVLPDTITDIENEAFSGCVELERIHLPDVVIRIGESAFYGCSSLKSVSVPGNVKQIGSFAFSRSGLTSIVLPDTVMFIGKGAFKNCDKLKSVTLPQGIIRVANAMFDDCDKLTSITIPDNVLYIGDNAFSLCTRLAGVTFPDGLISIGSMAFFGCASLKNLAIPPNVTVIGSAAFCECTALTGVSIPEGVASLGGTAFSYCIRLTEVTIPEGVTSIGESAFNLCGKLKSVVIPDSMKEIGASAFSGCKKLTSVTIPYSVVSIDEDAFKECKKLKIYCQPNSYALDYAVAHRISYQIIAAKDLTITSVEADQTVVGTDETVTWKAKATGGSGAKAYRFQLYKDGAPQSNGDFSAKNTFSYTPTEAGVYQVHAFVKDSVTTVDLYSDNLSVSSELQERPYPTTETVLFVDKEGGVCPLTIYNLSNLAYCVKVESGDDDEADVENTQETRKPGSIYNIPSFLHPKTIYHLVFFVRPGQTAEMMVPAGEYTIKFAAGNEWYGVKDLFGYYTGCFKADEPLSFTTYYSAYGNSISGYSIELSANMMGNMKMTMIDPSEF